MKSLVLPRPKSLKTLDITIQDPYEDLLATPVTLPEAEPADPQYEWTIASGDLPVFSLTPKSVKYVAHFFVAGKNNDAVSRYVDLRMVKWDGAAWQSVSIGGLSIVAGRYYTSTCCFYDIAIGDKIGVKLWCVEPGHDIDRDYQAGQVHPTRIFPYKAGTTLKGCNYSTVTGYPTLVEGSPSSVTAGFTIMLPETNISSSPITTAVNVGQLGIDSTMGIVRIARGDGATPDGLSVLTHATHHPYYRGNYIPTQIIYRSYGDID